MRKSLKKHEKIRKREKNVIEGGWKSKKKPQKTSKKHVFKHKKRHAIKIFLFEKQRLKKKFKKKLKNILVVWKNVVPLHPQSREVACETKTADVWKKNKIFFLKYFGSSKKCCNFAVRLAPKNERDKRKFFERLKTTKCSISTR